MAAVHQLTAVASPRGPDDALAPPTPQTRGLGLLMALVVSLALWAGIIKLAAAIL